MFNFRYLLFILELRTTKFTCVLEKWLTKIKKHETISGYPTDLKNKKTETVIKHIYFLFLEN